MHFLYVDPSLNDLMDAFAWIAWNLTQRAFTWILLCCNYLSAVSLSLALFSSMSEFFFFLLAKQNFKVVILCYYWTWDLEFFCKWTFKNICIKTWSRRIYNNFFRILIIYNCSGLKTTGTVLVSPSHRHPLPLLSPSLQVLRRNPQEWLSIYSHKELPWYTT